MDEPIGLNGLVQIMITHRLFNFISFSIIKTIFILCFVAIMVSCTNKTDDAFDFAVQSIHRGYLLPAYETLKPIALTDDSYSTRKKALDLIETECFKLAPLTFNKDLSSAAFFYSDYLESFPLGTKREEAKQFYPQSLVITLRDYQAIQAHQIGKISNFPGFYLKDYFNNQNVSWFSELFYGSALEMQGELININTDQYFADTLRPAVTYSLSLSPYVLVHIHYDSNRCEQDESYPKIVPSSFTMQDYVIFNSQIQNLILYNDILIIETYIAGGNNYLKKVEFNVLPRLLLEKLASLSQWYDQPEWLAIEEDDWLDWLIP